MSSNFFINLDSKFRSYGSVTDFSTTLDDFNLDPNQRVYLSLHSFSMYNLQYPINSNNNTIVFHENSVASDLTATITPGNYTLSELATELQQQLRNAGANTYTVTSDSKTGKLTVDAVIANTIKFISINEIFGFVPSDSFQSIVIADYPAILSGIEYVDICLPSIITECITNNNNTNGLLKRINLDVGWSYFISYVSDGNDDVVMVNKEYLDNIRVRILTPQGNVYDLPDNARVSIVLKANAVL